jgi:cephalosporin hydroxylase
VSHWALENLPGGWVNFGERMMELLEERHPVRCVELGTYKGASAIATARVIAQWGGHLTCVDTWADGPDGSPWMLAECLANFKSVGVENIDTIVGKSVEVGLAWTGGPIDYCYVDTEHTYDATTKELETWWPHIRVGGIISGDDYRRPEFPGCTAAWDDFDSQMGGLQREGLVWVVKRSNGPFVLDKGKRMRETSCASCHRAVWDVHVDGEGLCVLCALPPARSSETDRPVKDSSLAPHPSPKKDALKKELE